MHCSTKLRLRGQNNKKPGFCEEALVRWFSCSIRTLGHVAPRRASRSPRSLDSVVPSSSHSVTDVNWIAIIGRAMFTVRWAATASRRLQDVGRVCTDNVGIEKARNKKDETVKPAGCEWCWRNVGEHEDGERAFGSRTDNEKQVVRCERAWRTHTAVDARISSSVGSRVLLLLKSRDERQLRGLATSSLSARTQTLADTRLTRAPKRTKPGPLSSCPLGLVRRSPRSSLLLTTNN